MLLTFKKDYFAYQMKNSISQLKLSHLVQVANDNARL